MNLKRFAKNKRKYPTSLTFWVHSNFPDLTHSIWETDSTDFRVDADLIEAADFNDAADLTLVGALANFLVFTRC